MGLRAAAIALVAIAAISSPAGAQGHSGAPPGQLKKPMPSASHGNAAPGGGESGSPPVSSITPRSFGEWLDDATLAAPGSIWITTAATAWSAIGGHGADVPSLGVALGLAPRAQASLVLPFSRIVSEDQTVFRGVGDTYAGLKLLVVDPATHPVGVSCSPTLEVLSAYAATQRAGLVLPVSIEAGSGATRVYASTGYFSRGALFASAALERHLSSRVAVTGALLQSWSTADQAASTDLGLRRARTDVSGSLTAFVTPAVAVFGSIGRTLSELEYDSSRLVVSGGIAFAFTPPREQPVRPPR